MKTQKDLVKAWVKMELHSCYGSNNLPFVYDENKALQITEQGKKNLKMIQDIINKYE